MKLKKRPVKEDFADFKKRLAPLTGSLFARVYHENRSGIQVKKEKVAVKNLERIFMSTLSLSQQKGFQAMTLRELSRESGLSMGALYSYFGSKAGLRRLIFESGARLATEILQDEASRFQRPADRLAAAIRGHIYISELLRPWFYFAYMEAGKLSESELKKAKDNERLTESIFFDILAYGEEKGVFYLENKTLTSALIKAMLQDWYLKRWKYREAGTDVEEYADFVIWFVLKSILKEPVRRPHK